MDNLPGRRPTDPARDRPLRVLVVTESFLPQVNGVTNSVRRALEHLAAEGHHAMLVAPSGPGEYAGAPVHRVRSVAMPTYREFPVGLATRGHLRRLMAEFTPDVVHLASPAWLGHQAGEAARSLGIPVVAVYQTDLIGFAERYPFPGAVAAMRTLTRRVHAPADRTLVPSSASAEQLAALGIDRLHPWGRGVDTDLFAPERRDARVREELTVDAGEVLVGYVGRLAAEKELELLVHLRDLPGTRLVLVGGGPEEPRLRSLLPGAAFLGVRHGEDLAAIVASLDVFVHTGRTETFCQSAQEALASGVPVVAPRAGGPVDLVHEGASGFLYEPGDGPELSRLVSLLALDGPLRRRMGAAGVACVRERSWQAVNDQLLDHYRAVLRPAPARAPLRIGVIGTGHLGATHAAGMAEPGFEVVGVVPAAERPLREVYATSIAAGTPVVVGSFRGVRIAVLGAASKPDSDDVRDSPALDVARRLEQEGARVTVYDPAANLTARAVAPRLRYAANAVTACRKADLVLHLTEWAEFGRLDPELLGSVVRRKVPVGARNSLDVATWQAAGWVVQAPGRHISRPADVPDHPAVVDSLR